MDRGKLSPLDRLIVALDVPSTSDAENLVERIGGNAGFYKIGMELAYGGGLSLARDLIADGKKVFLDLKLHDIPNTVVKATSQIAAIGADFLTVHAYPQTMRAARQALENVPADCALKLLAVTVLTSSDDADLTEAGYAFGVQDLVTRRSQQARDERMHGIVLSAEEADAIRSNVGPDMVLVTPGIRPSGSDTGDQKRVMTPARAIAAGADFLVVGRPVTQAGDPAAAAAEIISDIGAALK